MKKKLVKLFEKDYIKSQIKKQAEDLYNKYKDKNPIFLVVLKGGAFYSVDLLRHFPEDFQYRIKYVSASSYKGEALNSCGKVDIFFLDCNKNTDWVRNEHVVILDEIAETFLTLYEIKNHNFLKNAKSIETCVLVEKPIGREISEIPDYFAVTHLGSEFLVGCGMGYLDLFRQLEDIYMLKLEE